MKEEWFDEKKMDIHLTISDGDNNDE